MIEEILGLRDAGQTDDADLEARLSREAVALLDAKLDPSTWVPLPIYEQFALVLQALEGGGRAEYMRERGERAGERLAAAGIYRQLKYVEKMRDDRSIELFTTDMRLMLSLQSALVNVGRWAVEPDPDHPDRVMVVARDAAAIPDCLAQAMEGFFVGVSRRGHEVMIGWQMTRPTPDQIVLRMDRDISTRA